MGFQHTYPSPNEQEFQPLGEWAKRLSIPANILLHHGSQGDLRLFVVPPHNAAFYSIHEKYLGSAADLPNDANPISMPEPGVIGLVLSRIDLARLSVGATIQQMLFPAMLRKQGPWGSVVSPIPRFGCQHLEAGWHIAGYDKAAQSPEGGWSFSSPITVKLSPQSVYLRDVDAQHFIDRVRSCEFISDCYDGHCITENLPSYVSGKLREVVDVNRLFWKNHASIDAPEKKRRRTSALSYLKGDFAALCDKTTSQGSLIAFAAATADPTLIPQSQRSPAGFATPDLLALLSAAKLYWSAYCKNPENPEVYPQRKDVNSFLQYMGIRESNASVAGTTLIRPEFARKARPSAKVYVRPTLSR